jgi:CubicO group peptidase (beta-lactamase class C family)
MKKFASALIVVLLIATASAQTKPPASAGDDEIRKRLDDYLSRIAQFGFSGAVLVAKGNEIVFNKGYGLAGREKNIPNTASTVFSTGSITKQFTAAAILKLEMQGKLKVEDSISRHLDNVPEDKKAITLHHLLTHTAGVISTGGGGYFPDRDKAVRGVLDAPLRFSPGARFLYSNEGYALLAAIIEKVSGRSYEEYLRENLFKPAGMISTGYRLPDWSKETVANWHAGQIDNGSPLDRPFPNWATLGSGEILSTTEDMFRWHLALLGNSILSDETKAKLFKPAINNYAYGWGVMKSPRGLLMAHDGGNTLGVGADIKRFIDAKVFIMAFCNDSGETMLLGDVRRNIAAIVFGSEIKMPPAAVPLDSSILAKRAGVYALASGSKITIEARDGKLVAFADGQDAMNLLVAGGSLDSERINALNARSLAIIQSAAKGDYAPLHEAFLKEVPLESLRLRQTELWSEWRKQQGEFKGVEIIGAAPEGEEDFFTYLRLNFERGSVVLRMYWGPRRLVGMRGGVLPAGKIFAPESATDFVSFDVSTSQIIRMNFKPDGRSLMLRTDKGETTATRIR